MPPSIFAAEQVNAYLFREQNPMFLAACSDVEGQTELTLVSYRRAKVGAMLCRGRTAINQDEVRFEPFGGVVTVRSLVLFDGASNRVWTFAGQTEARDGYEPVPFKPNQSLYFEPGDLQISCETLG